MPSLSGITVRVLSNGEPLDEYSTSPYLESASAATCWIASQVDQVFQIHHKFETEESCAWVCALSCDGHSMRNRLVRAGSNSYIEEKARNGGKVYSMMFSELQRTESQEMAQRASNPHLGEIKIQVWRVESTWTSRAGSHTEITIDESPIDESKKILGSHRVSLGNPKHASMRKAEVMFLDPVPYKTFTFYYRPRALLEALGHAPPASSNWAIQRRASALSGSGSGSESSSDEKSDVKPNLDEEDHAYLNAIDAQISELQRQRAGFVNKKQDGRSSSSWRKHKRVKREEQEIVVPMEARGEVIDLCSD